MRGGEAGGFVCLAGDCGIRPQVSGMRVRPRRRFLLVIEFIIDLLLNYGGVSRL